MQMMKLLWMMLLSFLAVSVSGYETYFIGDHTSVTHYVKDKTDIHYTLQTLLDSVKNSVDGGSITIASGTYILTKSIQIYNNTKINGAGMTETTLQLVDFADKFSNIGFIRCINCQNIVMSDITLDGNKHHQIIDGIDNDLLPNIRYEDSTRYGRYGIYVLNSYNVTINNVKMMNFEGSGITMTNSKLLRLENTLSTHNDFDGFGMENVNNVLISKSVSRSNGRNGFTVIGSSEIFIDNVKSFIDGYNDPDSSGCGALVQQTRNVSITNSFMIDPKKAGVCLRNTVNVKLIGNTNYERTCFRIEDTSNTFIDNNTCLNSNIRFTLFRNSNLQVFNTLNLSDSLTTYSGENLVIRIGYSNNADLRVREGFDAYAIFQQAFDEVKGNGKGKMYVEEGEYIISSYLQFPSNLTFIGAGINKTVLKLQNFAKPWWIPGTGRRRSGFLRSVNCENVVFYNVTLDGNKLNQNNDKYSQYGRFGLFTEACNNVYVDGMGIINFQGYGFDPHGIKITMTWGINLTIINSYAANNDWDGFTIDQSAKVLLENNTAINNGRHGYNIVTGSYDLTIINNTAYGNGYYYYAGNEGCGLTIQNNLQYGTKNAFVRNNYLVDSKDAGICLNDVVNMTVIENTILRNNTVSCIKTFFVNESLIENNICASSYIFAPPPTLSPPPPQKSWGIRHKVSYMSVVFIFFMIMLM